MERSLKAVLVFTVVYGLFSVALLSGQPYAGQTQVADAGGTSRHHLGVFISALPQPSSTRTSEQRSGVWSSAPLSRATAENRHGRFAFRNELSGAP